MNTPIHVSSHFHLSFSQQIQSWLVHIILKFSYFFFVKLMCEILHHFLQLSQSNWLS